MGYEVKEGEVKILRNKEEKFSRVLIWRGGVRFYKKEDYIFDVVRGRFIGEKPPKNRKLIVIDNNIFSGVSFSMDKYSFYEHLSMPQV